MARFVVVDTDVVVDFLRGRGPGADLVDALLRDDALLMTVITHFELVQGVGYPDERTRIAALLLHGQVPLTPASAGRAGDLSRELRKRGEGLATADVLQAGICIELGVPLATKNARHFSRVPGLEIMAPE